MKLPKGKIRITMPPFAHIVNVRLEGIYGLITVLMQISPEEMERKHAENRQDGEPLFYSVADQSIMLHPRPKEDYERFFVRFLPPEEEI